MLSSRKKAVDRIAFHHSSLDIMRPCRLLLWSLAAATTCPEVSCEEYVRTEPLALLDQLFPNQTLDDAWERYPLLSRATNSEDTCANNTIPTIFIPVNDKRALSRQERLEFVASLMNPSILGGIVDRYEELGYQYENDYKLKKNQGNYTLDYFINVTEAEKKLESWEQALKAVNEGYSIISDGLHMIWSPIARMTHILEEESGCNYATCNLYYTPPNNGGFESHWDWMDVIVVQVSGMKRWSVASQPDVYLSNHYQTKYRSNEGIPRFEEFIMYPGDMLYIPRGVTHNATTPLHSEEPSLHLTFGMEHQWFTTFEALVHHAINLYMEEAEGFAVTPSNEDCFVDWSEFLHYTISELARIDGVNACHLMRQSVPRRKAWKQIHALRHEQNGTVPSFEEAFTQDYNEILDTILELANVTETRTFFKELKYFGVASDGSYAFVGIDEGDVEESVACLHDAQVDEIQFNSTVKEFVAFAKQNQAAAMGSLEKLQATKHFKARQEDNFWLVRKWGHTAKCSDKYPLALRYSDDSKDCQ